MERQIEADESGILRIGPEMIAGIQPHDRFVVDRENGNITLKPVEPSRNQWASLTPSEKASEFRQWANRPRRAAPDIPDRALDREHIYD